jgi:hypothetical protein
MSSLNSLQLLYLILAYSNKLKTNKNINKHKIIHRKKTFYKLKS